MESNLYLCICCWVAAYISRYCTLSGANSEGIIITVCTMRRIQTALIICITASSGGVSVPSVCLIGGICLLLCQVAFSVPSAFYCAICLIWHSKLCHLVFSENFSIKEKPFGTVPNDGGRVAFSRRNVPQPTIMFAGKIHSRAMPSCEPDMTAWSKLGRCPRHA